MSDYCERRQAETRAAATRNGEGWTLAEIIAACDAHPSVAVATLALALGRTYYAVQSARAAARNGTALGGGAARSVGKPRDGRDGRAYVGWMEGDDDNDASDALIATLAAPRRTLA